MAVVDETFGSRRKRNLYRTIHRSWPAHRRGRGCSERGSVGGRMAAPGPFVIRWAGCAQLTQGMRALVVALMPLLPMVAAVVPCLARAVAASCRAPLSAGMLLGEVQNASGCLAGSQLASGVAS